MIKRVHSKEVHYITSLEEIMDKLDIPNSPEIEYIGFEHDPKSDMFTFKQIETVD